MGCSCVNSPSPDSSVNDFWSTLPLREKPYKDLDELIRIKKQGNQPITQKKFSLLLESLMKGQNSAYELAIELFIKALDEAKKLQNEGLLFLAIIILGKGIKDEFISVFIELAMTVGGLKTSIIIEGKEKRKHIKSLKLKEFLVYYTRLITQMGIPILYSLYDNKRLFEAYWEKITDSKIDEFVNEVFMSTYDKEKVEWVDFEKFLDANYESLRNDIKIRNHFTADPSLTHS